METFQRGDWSSALFQSRNSSAVEQPFARLLLLDSHAGLRDDCREFADPEHTLDNHTALEASALTDDVKTSNCSPFQLWLSVIRMNALLA
jgi:hypothetical protein